MRAVPVDISDGGPIAAEDGAAWGREVAGGIVAVTEGRVEGVCAEGDRLVAVCADFLVGAGGGS